MKLDIILRTHDNRSVHNIKRIVDATKQEIVFRCVNSLIKTINKADADITLTVIDDHSSDDTLFILNKILSGSKYGFNLIHLEDTGNNASLREWYGIAKKSNADAVYCVEDDYLHVERAITDMIDCWRKFSKNLDCDIALHPLDDLDMYRPDSIKPSRVVLGPSSHWRTCHYCTGTMWIAPKTMNRHWSLFKKIIDLYGTKEGERLNIHEGTTFSKIWTGDTVLFTPLDPLAVHLNENEPPYFDYKELWEENKI